MDDQSIYEAILFAVKCGAAVIALLALAVIVMAHEGGVNVVEDDGEYE